MYAICYNCHYFHRTGGAPVTDPLFGRCKRYPPGPPDGVQPTVAGDDTCGEWSIRRGHHG